MLKIDSMANITQISPFTVDIVKKAKFKNKILFWVITTSITSSMTYIVTNNIFMPLFSFLFVSILVKELYFSKNVNNIYLSGEQGEKNALKVLKKLPKSFTIFNQIEIPSSESSFNEFETDFIVVGRNSVFIVEVKNYHGHIICTNVNSDWTKQNFHRDGSISSTEIIKSPFMQVKNQKKILFGYLKKIDLELDIKTIIFLDMNKKDYEIKKSEEIPVFNDKKVNKYIKKIDQSRSSFINGYKREELINILQNLNGHSQSSRRTRLKDKNYLKGYFKEEEKRTKYGGRKNDYPRRNDFGRKNHKVRKT